MGVSSDFQVKNPEAISFEEKTTAKILHMVKKSLLYCNNHLKNIIKMSLFKIRDYQFNTTGSFYIMHHKM